MSDSTPEPRYLDLTAEIVSAHVGHNDVAAEALPVLIQTVYRTLTGIAARSVQAPAPAERLQPAVPIKRSVFADHIVCLEDGKKLKMLKRHLQTAYNMTPDQYRARWGLPSDYPMVAPAYASHRSTLAKSIGLGRKKAEIEPPDEPKPEPTVIHVPARRARGSRG
jgi:predicted transcriptional regulator